MKKWCLIGICSLFIFGCAAHQNKTINKRFSHQIPPGVDSLIAVHADSLADLCFVDITRKSKSANYDSQSKEIFIIADSLFFSYDKLKDTNIVHSSHDSTEFETFYWQCWQYVKPQKDGQYFPKPEHVQSLVFDLYLKSKNLAEQAKLTNPFHLNVRINLIQILIKLGKFSCDKHYCQTAIEELNDFLTYERSQDHIYSLMAQCYYALSDWENAYLYFRQALQMLEHVAVFQNADLQITEVDTSKLIYYLQELGDTKAKVYDAENALQFLQQALIFSSSPEKKKQIQNYIDWINWDDGNILAVEKRDAVYELYQQKKYKKANSEAKKLLKILKTQRTKNQINWKIATTDFQLLNNPNKGIERLFHVVKKLPVNQLQDSSAVIYFSDYGAMCYSMGMYYLEKKMYKMAYAYLLQASQVNWDGKGKSSFHLAKLSQSDAAETIKNCQQALQYIDHLSPQMINETYELLTDAHKRNGDFKLARKYYLLINQNLTVNSY